jgi:hypothetical protein
MSPENRALTSIVSFQRVLLRSTLEKVRPDQSSNPVATTPGLSLPSGARRPASGCHQTPARSRRLALYGSHAAVS